MKDTDKIEKLARELFELIISNGLTVENCSKYIQMAYMVGLGDGVKNIQTRRVRPVGALDAYGDVLKRFAQVKLAATWAGTDEANIRNAIKKNWTCKGYKWKYID